MTRILSIDPSGTSISGLFYFENWGKWQAYSCPSEKGSKFWLDHAKFLEEEVKNKQIQVIVVETGKIFNRNPQGKQYNYGYQMDDLIKCAGFCEYLGMKYGAEVIKITNQQRKYYEKYIELGQIPGLEIKKVKRQFEGTTRTSSRSLYHFKGQELNEHEKDAILLLYCYWVKKLKKEWPFA